MNFLTFSVTVNCIYNWDRRSAEYGVRSAECRQSVERRKCGLWKPKSVEKHSVSFTLRTLRFPHNRQFI